MPTPEGSLTVLEEAQIATSTARPEAYGHPSVQFLKAANMLNALNYTRDGKPLIAADIGVIMLAVKLSRLVNEPTLYQRDTLVDIAGYARTIEAASTEAVKAKS